MQHCLLRPNQFIRAILFTICLQLLSMAVDAGELSQPKFVLEWGKKGEAPGEFQSPIGIAFNSRDEIFITDLNNARIQKFSTDGKYLGGFDLARDNPDRKSTMIGGIAIDADGRLYLTYMSKHKVGVFDESGELIREWGKKGLESGEFNQPGGIIFVAKDRMLIADQCNHRVQVFSNEGAFLGQWGSYGSEPGQFDGVGPQGSRFGGPHFLAQDSQGRLFTTEGIQGRVQQFSAEGTFLAKWGNKGDQPGGFGSYQFSNTPHSFGPIGIAIDPFDRVLVSSLNDRVQFFEATGKYLFDIRGTGLDQGGLLHPHGMAFDRKGCLYICDAGNHRILKFEIPSPVSAINPATRE